jgi:hypothetical protein
MTPVYAILDFREILGRRISRSELLGHYRSSLRDFLNGPTVSI